MECDCREVLGRVVFLRIKRVHGADAWLNARHIVAIIPLDNEEDAATEVQTVTGHGGMIYTNERADDLIDRVCEKG